MSDITSITIKLSNTKATTISLKEAKELYNELHSIFNKTLTFPNTPVYPYGGTPRNPVWKDTTTPREQVRDGVWCKVNTNIVDPSKHG